MWRRLGGAGAGAGGGTGTRGCVSERREPASIERAAVRRGGRRERACHALPLDMAGARALVAACWSWWWLTIAAGKYHFLKLVSRSPRELAEQLIAARLILLKPNFLRFRSI